MFQPERKFTRTVENFTCEHCGTEVKGTGYTDHCPDCLWGKHVDVHPGDRAEECQGALEPVGLKVKKGGGWQIFYRCVSCKKILVCITAPGDNQEIIIGLSARPLFDSK